MKPRSQSHCLKPWLREAEKDQVQLDVTFDACTLLVLESWPPVRQKVSHGLGQSQALLVGFGFGLRNVKPKPDEAKRKPGLPNQSLFTANSTATPSPKAGRNVKAL
ncbi:hypothetical protein B0H13DRAFT_1882301 [Mycena leptocephala]|nr:hypothetical protein B0H13DRAFT_1882301 [Mycena leptocephala]